jgi:thiamine biosynthesis lipoprotein
VNVSKKRVAAVSRPPTEAFSRCKIAVRKPLRGRRLKSAFAASRVKHRRLKPAVSYFASSLSLVNITLLTACGQPADEAPAVYREARPLMGTVATVEAVAASEDTAARAVEAAFLALHHVDTIANAVDPESDLGRVNRAAAGAPTVVDPELAELVSFALTTAEVTDGRFNPAVGPLVEAYGIKGRLRLPGGRPRLPDDAEVKRLLPLCDYTKVTVPDERSIVLEEEGMALDLSAVAKGWAVDRAYEALLDGGCAAGLVEAGGEVRCFGGGVRGEPWRIGIKDPWGPGVYGVIEMEKGVLATSGTYEQTFEVEGAVFSHIIDPSTGFPADGPSSVTVTAEDCATADAWATALMTLPPEDAYDIIESNDELEGLILYRTEYGKKMELVSRGFPILK